MELNELKSKCATILLNGNIHFSEVGDELMVDLSEDDKQVLIEYAVSHILKDCLEQFADKVEKDGVQA
jgi:hypothetical protein